MLKKSLLLITLSLTLCTDLLVTTLAVSAKPAATTRTQVKPQTSRPASKPARRRLIGFKVPRIRGSRNLEAGAARGKCTSDTISAVSSPKTVAIEKDKVPVEITVSNRPTFFVNVPETSATQASFLLKSEDNDVLLEKTLSVSATKGILAYTLPTDYSGLEAGKKYRWRLSLLCNPNSGDRSGDANAGGWIELKKPDQPVAKQLEATTDPIDRAAIYADYGYLQDSLKTLADLRATNPNDPDLANNWSALFKTVYLPKLAQQPIIQLEAITSDTQ
ncbi:hypothetical protein NIES4074_46800 [Cylindrospermum sp. NIES-4074]|nr:hypothetical protein NIES4074_46800 [Cylindrospermum sp. NIES-4074]